MRRITAGLFITVNGVIEAPEKWNPPYYDEEMSQAVMPQLAAAGLHLYGRRSYELFRAVFTGPKPAYKGGKPCANYAIKPRFPLFCALCSSLIACHSGGTLTWPISRRWQARIALG